MPHFFNAVHLAALFLELPYIVSVQFYGKLLLGDTVETVDLLLLANDYSFYVRFLRELELAKRRHGDGIRNVNADQLTALKCAQREPRHMEQFETQVVAVYGDLPERLPLNLFVLPLDWEEQREDLELVDTHLSVDRHVCGLPSTDPELVSHIAKSATVLARRGPWLDGYKAGFGNGKQGVHPRFKAGFVLGKYVNKHLTDARR